jgi:ABC-type glutathione transport system ATPase component
MPAAHAARRSLHPSMKIIQLINVTKQFKRKRKRAGFMGSLSMLVKPEYETITAVDRISFSVEQGEMIGYIGPNGAGKSTTIKMLSGILVPTDGIIEVKGLTRRDSAKTTRIISGSFLGSAHTCGGTCRSSTACISSRISIRSPKLASTTIC